MSASAVLGVGAMVLFVAIGLAAPYYRWGAPIVQIWDQILDWIKPIPATAGVARSMCTHWQAVPCRESATDEIVAWLCPNCDQQLTQRPALALPPLSSFASSSSLGPPIKE